MVRKKNLNRISVEEVLEVVRSAGLLVEEKSAYYKCSSPSDPKLRVYVARTKKVGRIHIAGLGIVHDAIIPITSEEAKELRMGSVRGELDFSLKPDEVLNALRVVCKEIHQPRPVVCSGWTHIKKTDSSNQEEVKAKA